MNDQLHDAISGLALAAGTPSLHLGMLPWTGQTLTYVLFFSSIFGLIAVILAMRARLRALFFLWSLAVPVLLVKGYIFSGYHFAVGEALPAAGLIAASLVALAGAWFQLWRKIERARWR